MHNLYSLFKGFSCVALVIGVTACATQRTLQFELASAGDWRVVPLRWDAKPGASCSDDVISQAQLQYFWLNAQEISSTQWQQRDIVKQCQTSGLVHVNNASYDFYVTADGYGTLWLGNQAQHYFRCVNCLDSWANSALSN